MRPRFLIPVFSFLLLNAAPGAAQANAKQNFLAKTYSQAIADYLVEASKQKLLTTDSLYIGKRKHGQSDDFPDIQLPPIINNKRIILIDPEAGKKLQLEQPSTVYINLLGWVEKRKSEFTFVTFSNGFQHKFDIHLSYHYNGQSKAFVLSGSKVEIFKKE